MKNTVLYLVATIFLAMNISCAQSAGLAGKAGVERYLVFVGTYTRGESKGIHVLELDMKSGALTHKSEIASVNPTFVALHPSGHYLYAVNEVGSFQGKPTGGVSAFAIERGTGKLTLLNEQSSGGPGPCHLVVDRAGKNVLVANYGGGSVACLPIGDDGKLEPPSSFIQHEGSSVDPRRQQGPHAHWIDLDSTNRHAFSCDLGLDKVLIYRFDPAAGRLTPHDPPSASVTPGSGPRHLVFGQDARFAYVNNEMSSTVTAFKYDAKRGTLSPFESVSTLPEGGHRGNSTAEIAIHPTGKFLYCSNRGHNSIAVFAIDSATGALTPVERESTGGKTPRHFAIDPTGTYLLAENQGTGSIVVLRIDGRTGALEPTGQRIDMPSPVCAQFLAK